MKRDIGLFGFLFVVLLAGFVFAASTPTNLIFNNNASADYDEGSFFVNWSVSGDSAVSYILYIFANNNLFTTSMNDSISGYSFANTTEANYTFIVEAENATGTKTNSSSNISLYVDSTVPSVSLPLYDNATAKKVNENLTLNISVSDSISGFTNSFCLVNFNGSSNNSIAVNSGWCNSTINLSGISEGVLTLNVYVNDTVNNFALNNSFVVSVDSTAPVPSASCSPSPANTGEAVTCVCSGTDSISGVASASPGSVFETPNSGKFDYLCSVTDNAGNSASATFTYIVKSSGGGSFFPQNLSVKVHSFRNAGPDFPSIVRNFDSDFGLDEIHLNFNQNAENVRVSVTKYDLTPSEVSAYNSGDVYQYLQIEVDNLDQSLDNAVLISRVERSWITSQELNKEDMVLFKFDEEENAWKEIRTDYQREDEKYYYYMSELESFSYFAISEKGTLEDRDSAFDENDIQEKELEKETNLTRIWLLVLLAVAFLVWFFLNKFRKNGKNFLKFSN